MLEVLRLRRILSRVNSGAMRIGSRIKYVFHMTLLDVNDFYDPMVKISGSFLKNWMKKGYAIY